MRSIRGMPALLAGRSAALTALFATVLVLPARGQEAGAGRPITPRDLWGMARVGAPVLSPDGRTVAYTVTRYDVGANEGRTRIWTVPAEGGPARPLTTPVGSSTSPAWSPDGSRIAFVSTRGGNGPQIHVMPVGGGEALPVTDLPGGARGPVWFADGKRLLFTSEIWPDDDPDAARLRELAEGPSDARVYDDLFYRHWDEWEDGRRSHVFVLDLETEEVRDLTPGPYDTPPLGLGGFHDFDVSPDGRELAFVRNTDEQPAVGTGNDIWLVPVEGGEPELLTESDANDVSPVYSPDGRWIAYLAQRRPGFEADRTRLVLHDRRTGERRRLTEALDRSVSSFAWSGDSRTLHFLAQDRIWRSLYRIPVDGGEAEKLTEELYIGGFALSRDGRTLLVSRQAIDRPAELYALAPGGSGGLRPLTGTNDELVRELDLSPAEPFWFEGAGETPVQGFLVKPPGFDPSRRYPVVFLVHGGPQGAWSDSFHYRWNANLFAAPGYVAVLINPRGSTGYGQRFTDEITGDWGGKVFEDLMKGLDFVLDEHPFLDGDRMVAAGASYGGYMMNWFEGHTTRFRALVNHDGVYNTVSMYGATEELWFPEWEFRGKPWSNPELYERWNPAGSVTAFRTPMLIIHGALDYRVPLEQGLEAFTALRRNGIRARFLYFPDEGHWVLKPANAMVWWETVYDWIDEYVR